MRESVPEPAPNVWTAPQRSGIVRTMQCSKTAPAVGSRDRLPGADDHDEGFGTRRGRPVRVYRKEARNNEYTAHVYANRQGSAP